MLSWKRIGLGLGCVLALAAAVYCYRHFMSVSYENFEDLKPEHIKETDYKRIVALHNECFIPDSNKYVFEYLVKSRFSSASEFEKAQLRKNVEQYVSDQAREKINSMRDTVNVGAIRHNGEIIGFYNCQPEWDVTQGSTMIFNVCVAAKERGHGYGRKLMEHAIATCRKDVRGDLTLTVYKDNGFIIELYKKLGFKEVPTYPLPEDDFFMFGKLLMKYQP